ncbi:MAG: hypothetical protein IKT43_01680, partial [Clostridia bacterium]|nr:hypothetical protein [Clostridia bacterium]
GCAKAVILNLNPGMSDTICYGAYKGTNAEDTKCFRNFNQPIGWLIKKFRDEHDKKYSSFCSQWSPLNPQLRDRKNYPNYVCGLKWWQGINPDRVQGKRVPWLKRIYGNAQLSPGEVFALELCPYHSKEFSWRRNCAVCKILMPCL